MPRLPKGVFIRDRRKDESKDEKRREGRYYCRVRDGVGRRVWLALGDNLDLATERYRDIKARGAAPTSRATVRELALRWLSTYVATRRIPRNRISTANRTERYLIPFMGDMLARNVTKDDMRGYRLHLEKKGLKPGTVRLYLADTCCLFRWAEDSGYLERVPVPKGLLPVLQEEPPKGLNDEEVSRLVALPDQLGFACRLLLGSGMRWGELIQAQASDIGKDGVLSISHETKNRKVRRVLLPASLAAECRGHVGKLVPWERPSSDCFNGKVSKAAKVPSFHAHRLRHTFGYRWVEHGGQLAALQRMMGHASLDMTMRYVRADDGMVRREAERVHLAGNW